MSTGADPSPGPGVDPGWSRRVTVAGRDGVAHDWHVLDNGVTDPVGTLLCVHGNPTWSYLWRRLLARGPARLAGGGAGPARDGLVGADGRTPATGRPGGRPG